MATDGRYFLQAENQLDSNWKLLKQGVPNVPSWRDWVVKEVRNKKCKVGVDPRFFSYSEYSALVSELEQYELQDSLIPVTQNLVDLVWGDEQPKPRKDKVKVLPLKYSGLSSIEKSNQVRKIVEAKRCSGFVVTSLDEVAWLLNLRGSDISYNPVFRAFAYVSDKDIVLYIDQDKIDNETAKYLEESNIKAKSYEAISDDLYKAMTELIKYNDSVETCDLRKKILVSESISWNLYQLLGGKKMVTVATSPVEICKAIKNDVEIKGARECQIRDGAALIKYFAWLENELKNGNIYSDYDAGLQAEKFRSEMENYQGLSFETISSSGPKAAVIHYSPEKDSKFMVDINQVYLCDSGAQYLDGTTDTTRTLFFGEKVDPEIQHRYTLVLKGHIAIARTIFPEGTNGYYIDVLARQFLWNEGLDYRHGTGHGVGSFLMVHEGPIGIGQRPNYVSSSFRPGNILSNEPGYYKDGEYGIRIENVILVKEHEDSPNEFGKKTLAFETLTRVPMCRKLIKVEALTEQEIKWLNEYHQKVYDDTVSHVSHDKISLEWLKRETAPL